MITEFTDLAEIVLCVRNEETWDLVSSRLVPTFRVSS